MKPILGDTSANENAKKVFGYITDIDYKEYTVTVGVGFLEPYQIEQLEKMKNTMEPVKLTIQPVNKTVKMKTLPQHRKFFAMLRDILKWKRSKDSTIVINALSMRIVYDEVRKSYFPVRIVNLGKEEVFTVPSIRELTMDELREVISNMYNDYSELGVDFDEYKKSI
jgi:hypothetical protein